MFDTLKYKGIEFPGWQAYDSPGAGWELRCKTKEEMQLVEGVYRANSTPLVACAPFMQFTNAEYDTFIKNAWMLIGDAPAILAELIAEQKRAEDLLYTLQRIVDGDVEADECFDTVAEHAIEAYHKSRRT